MRKYAKALIGLSFVGALNALYLTLLFVRTKWAEHASSICDINSYASCTSVITNPHALFLGGMQRRRHSRKLPSPRRRSRACCRS